MGKYEPPSRGYVGGITQPQARLLYILHSTNSRLIVGGQIAWAEHYDTRTSRLTFRMLIEQGFLAYDPDFIPSRKSVRGFKLTQKAEEWLRQNHEELQRSVVGSSADPSAGSATT